MHKDIHIIGAGLVGSLLAIYLRKRGYDVHVHERRPDMRAHSMQAGRSINLALSDRGIRALEEVGIMDDIRKIAIPMHGRLMHHPDGSTAYQPYGKEGQYINSVSRGDLNKMLMTLAEKEGAHLHFDRKCDSVGWKTNTIYFTEGNATIDVQADLIFGSDGAYSAARLTHQLQHDRFEYTQHYINYGYKELHIPAGADGNFQMEANALHIWPRGEYMMIALPNIDGSFTCTLFFPFEGDPSFASLQTPDQVMDFFSTSFADAVPLMPTLLEDYQANPTGSLVTVYCYPWIREDRFSLIGDAAHAIVPFFGQGMNCGFEDCSVLNGLVDEYAGDWKKILPAFQSLRKPDADAIAELALNNFIEMRDKVADPVFLLQKKIEQRFSAKYPGDWTPAYGLVTFSPHIRYSEALATGKRQQAIMDNIMALENIDSKWDSEEVEMAIREQLEKYKAAV